MRPFDAFPVQVCTLLMAYQRCLPATGRIASSLGHFVRIGEDAIKGIDASNVNEISASQKAAIFGPKFAGYQARDAETKAVLRRLRQYSPAAADCFASKASRTSDFAFRLISRHKNGLTATARPSFVALSYRWTARLDGDMALPVPPLLWAAASQELQSDDEGLWVDQLCIQQLDDVEKTLSIGLMDMIYEEARSTVVILTDVEVSLQEMKCIEWKSQDGDGTHLSKTSRRTSTDQTPFDLALRVLGSDYFQRAWCSHEYRLSADQIIICPCAKPGYVFRMTGETLLSMAAQLGNFKSAISPQRLQNALDTIISAFGFSQRGGSQQSLAVSQSIGGAFQTLENFHAGGDYGRNFSEHHRERTAYRDRLAIVLNSVQSNVLLLPEPYHSPARLTEKPADEHVRKVHFLSLARRDFLIFCCMGPALHTSPPSDRYSWLNNTEVSSYLSLDEFEPFEDNEQLGLVQSANDTYIQLKMTILRLKLKEPRRLFVNLAADILQAMIKEGGLNPETLSGCSGSGKIDWRGVYWGREQAFMLTLACVLDLGINWCWTYLARGYGTFNGHRELYTAFAPHLNDRDIFGRLTRGLSKGSSRHDVRSRLGSSLYNVVVTLLSCTAELIREERCWETWCHFVVPMRHAPMLVSLDDGATYQYLLFRPYISTSETPVQTVFGIPTALVQHHTNYGHRFWSLGCSSSSSDRNGPELSLLHKSSLFGPSLSSQSLPEPKLLKVFGPPRSLAQLTDPGSRWGLRDYWLSNRPDSATYAGVSWAALQPPRAPSSQDESTIFKLQALVRSLEGIWQSSLTRLPKTEATFSDTAPEAR